MFFKFSESMSEPKVRPASAPATANNSPQFQSISVEPDKLAGLSAWIQCVAVIQFDLELGPVSY